MNATLVRDWLLYEAMRHHWILAWLAGLIFLTAVLGINLVTCLWQRLERTNRDSRGIRFWAFFGIHFFFGLVMLMHGLEMVVGEKYPWQSIRAGEEIRLDSDWRVHAHNINYINDISILNSNRGQRRRSTTRDSFDTQANFVRVSLLWRNREVATGDVKIMQPLVHGNIHVVLRRFEYGPEGLSARMRVVDAPLHKFFFTAYLLLICNLIGWLFLRLVRL